MLCIPISHEVAARAPRATARTLATAAMFGLGLDEQQQCTLIPPCDFRLPIPGPGVVFITGPSGGGKSTLLRLICEACERANRCVIRLNDLPRVPRGGALVDCLGRSLEQALEMLSLAGLGDAFALLRRPHELSDGQRARFHLARAMDAAQRAGEPCVIAADEFAATLDRLTAQVLARNLRRWIDSTSHTLIAATTHDDLLEALQPDVLIHKGLGEAMEVAADARARG